MSKENGRLSHDVISRLKKKHEKLKAIVVENGEAKFGIKGVFDTFSTGAQDIIKENSNGHEDVAKDQLLSEIKNMIEAYGNQNPRELAVSMLFYSEQLDAYPEALQKNKSALFRKVAKK